MTSFVNPAYAPGEVPAVSGDALAFHRALPGYAPTPVHDLGGGVWLKDESNRLGLPAFKVLGVSWAVERALRADPSLETLVAASAGNHGRAVAHVAAQRGLRARVFLPARSVAARREAIAGEGADVVVVDGTYEDAVRLAEREGAQPGCAELADVGSSGPAHWVIDGYATLFAELDDAAPAREAAPAHDTTPPQPTGARPFDTIFVPVGVGSLGAAAARYGAATGTAVVAVEPDVAACLTASLAAGTPTAVDTPGTAMAGLDCAEVSAAAWSSLKPGITATVTVSDAQTAAAMKELAQRGLAIGHSGAATLAGLRAYDTPGDLGRVLLIATEGPTDPEGYRAAIGDARLAARVAATTRPEGSFSRARRDPT